MKRTLLPLTALAFSVNAMAQFGTAPDFTVTDINSATHHLYSWLNAGKVVVVDASATWCGPCWSLHQSHALKNLYENYGPDGTDQIRVLFYEADASTTMADLQGLTGGTQGDWLTGTPYPVVNESPLTLSGNVWWPQGFPTVSLIRPSDKEIVEDMWNWNYTQMVNAINQIITLGQVGIAEEGNELASITTYPVPVADVLNVDMSAANAAIDNIVVTDATGRVVANVAVGNDQRVEMNVASYEGGVYFLNLMSGARTAGIKQFVK